MHHDFTTGGWGVYLFWKSQSKRKPDELKRGNILLQANIRRLRYQRGCWRPCKVFSSHPSVHYHSPLSCCQTPGINSTLQKLYTFTTPPILPPHRYTHLIIFLEVCQNLLTLGSGSVDVTHHVESTKNTLIWLWHDIKLNKHTLLANHLPLRS